MIRRQPRPASTRPATTHPASSQPATTRPATSRSANSQPATTRPATSSKHSKSVKGPVRSRRNSKYYPRSATGSVRGEKILGNAVALSELESLPTSSSEEEVEDEAPVIQPAVAPTEKDALGAEEQEALGVIDTEKIIAETRSQIAKLVKYAKIGNQTATVIALCALLEYDLANDPLQQQIVQDTGGLEVLLNILETDDFRCKIGALMVLKKISSSPGIRKAIAGLRGAETLVEILFEVNRQLRCLAAEALSYVGKYKKSRRALRKARAIPRLIDMMDAPDDVLYTSHTIDVDGLSDELLEVRTATKALLALLSSKLNREILLKSGGIFVLSRLLETSQKETLIPAVAVVQQCAVEAQFRSALRTGGMIEHLVRLLTSSHDQDLLEQCALALSKAAEDPEVRDLVGTHGGLEVFVKLLENQENTSLLVAVSGAVWKCSLWPKNLEKLQELKSIKEFVALLHHSSEAVLINVVGTLAETACHDVNRKMIFKLDGVRYLVKMLSRTDTTLLVNVAKAVSACALNRQITDLIIDLDGIRLLWSHLRHPEPQVQAASASAICQLLTTRGVDSGATGEIVRSLVGGLELLVNRLQSSSVEVVAGVCAAVAVIAKDPENLAVLTDHGIVPILALLSRSRTTEDILRENLAKAIARCSNHGDNRATFGEHDAVAPLVSFFTLSSNSRVHSAITQALEQLSHHPSNCLVMHSEGVVEHLLKLCGTKDPKVQEAAANCLQNIRHVTRQARSSRKPRRRTR